MSCAFCLRLRSLLFGPRRQCEACEKAMRAVAKHERSTQNLTRAALDGIDHNAIVSGEVESQNDIRTLVEDMLLSMGPSRKAKEAGRHHEA